MAEKDALPALRALLAADTGSQASAERIATGLSALSNLPGPRANLAVAHAFAREAPPGLVWAVADLARDDEYVSTCAVMAMGRLWAEEPSAGWRERVRRAADDPRWRVREGAAMALQLLGESRPDLLRDAVARWSADADPYLARAAIAGICEPPLLADRHTALAALDACEAATHVVLASADRRAEGVRTLRQALGYCWSVAVAAAPEPGLARFLAIDASDPDVAWIVRENRGKARLKRLVA